jgi:hypothetical protein
MYNEMLNGIITEKEVLDAIKGLKNNKAKILSIVDYPFRKPA